MRQCNCGGIVRQWDLTDGRERWECNACGRRHTFTREEPTTADQPRDLFADNYDAQAHANAYPGF
jgi:hypothetical protein